MPINKFMPCYLYLLYYYGLVVLRAGLLVQSIAVDSHSPVNVNGTATAAPSLIFMPPAAGDVKNITENACGEEEPDGFCNDEYNIPQCGFDAGDCIDIHAKDGKDGKDLVISMDLYPNCSQVLFLRHGHDEDMHISWKDETEKVGNGICDTSHFNIEECGFEFGECVEFNEEYSLCNYGYNDSLKFGNGICDREFNNRECKYDKGDCKPRVAFSIKLYIMAGIAALSILGCVCLCGAGFLQNRHQGFQLSGDTQRPTRLRQYRLRRLPNYMVADLTSHQMEFMSVVDEDRRNDILNRIIRKVCIMSGKRVFTFLLTVFELWLS